MRRGTYREPGRPRRRRGAGHGRRGTAPGRGLLERIALAAISLAFVGVFVATYLSGEAARPSRGQAFFQAAPPEDAARMPSGLRPAPDAGPGLPRPASDVAAPSRVTGRRFVICHTGGGFDCVVDGDTAWIAGEKVRVADIDAPETHPPRCDFEADLGDRATRRLAELMNAGPFEVRSIDRDTDRYGRKLRVLVRDGRSLGDQLVAEGLARTWEGRRRPWC